MHITLTFFQAEREERVEEEDRVQEELGAQVVLLMVDQVQVEQAARRSDEVVWVMALLAQTILCLV